jgi:hypothetical protein
MAKEAHVDKNLDSERDKENVHMYSREDRMKAIELYMKNVTNARLM